MVCWLPCALTGHGSLATTDRAILQMKVCAIADLCETMSKTMAHKSEAQQTNSTTMMKMTSRKSDKKQLHVLEQQQRDPLPHNVPEPLHLLIL